MKKILLLMFGLLLMACQSNNIIATVEEEPSQELTAFLPVELSEFVGDGGYYHQFNRIEDHSTLGLAKKTVVGEVKNTLAIKDKSKLTFLITHWIDSEKWVQTVDQSMLNESQWTEIILLKEPLKVGNVWSFRTKNTMGSKVTVSGKITEVDDLGERITIEFTDSLGAFEKRTVEKGLGTTTFTRKVVYKSAASYTGYQYMGEKYDPSHLSELEIFNKVTAIDLPAKMFEVITTFNRVWAESNETNALNLMNWVEEYSTAAEKINATQWRSDYKITMLEIKPIRYETFNDYVMVYTYEAYQTGESEQMINQMVYTLVALDERYVIRDFEATTFEH